MKREEYDPARDHDPLPLDIPPVPTGSVEQIRALSQRSVKWGLCPGHSLGRGTGLVHQGKHLVWRLHRKHTHGGLAIDCSASGQPVCELPSREGRSVRCTCGGPR